MALLNEIQLKQFEQHLVNEECAASTIEKYLRDIRAFLSSPAYKTGLSKEMILDYKKSLSEKYKSTSANSMLVALNKFLSFCGHRDLQVKLLKIQHRSYREQDKELSLEEYKKLVLEAKRNKNERLCLLIQTICSTGIRVSEHQYITAETLRSGTVRISNKGKERTVFLSKDLRQLLAGYCRKNRIITGPVFITKNGTPLNRCNIWAEMKALCKNTGIEPKKVFPHNLRHLFALTYYRLEKDIVRLADILGHTNIETTRIYTSTTEEECVRSLSRLNLLL